jgi:hypothetical protein
MTEGTQTTNAQFGGCSGFPATRYFQTIRRDIGKMLVDKGCEIVPAVRKKLG